LRRAAQYYWSIPKVRRKYLLKSVSSAFYLGITLQVVEKKRRLETGGEGGIRTPDTLSGMPVFKTGAINHSATSPALIVLL
jgi:hypothetical protein